MSLQLETVRAPFKGRTYTLVCNNAALEALEDRYGSMKAVMVDTPDHVAVKLFEAMLNRARRKLGEEDATHEDVSEEYNYAMLRELDIFGMFLRALSPKSPRKEETPETEAPLQADAKKTGGNRKTGKSRPA